MIDELKEDLDRKKKEREERWIEYRKKKDEERAEYNKQLTNIKECSTCIPNRYEDYANWGIKKIDKIMNPEYKKIRNRNRICPVCKTIFSVKDYYYNPQKSFPRLGTLHTRCSLKIMDGTENPARIAHDYAKSETKHLEDKIWHDDDIGGYKLRELENKRRKLFNESYHRKFDEVMKELGEIYGIRHSNIGMKQMKKDAIKKMRLIHKIQNKIIRKIRIELAAMGSINKVKSANPKMLAACTMYVLYRYANMYGGTVGLAQGITQRQISELFLTTEVTIRNNYKPLSEFVGEELLKELEDAMGEYY